MNVLFLCNGNSARSIMAEGLLNKYSNGRFQAFSAGSFPTGQVNPSALERLELEGITLTDARSKSWDEFAKPDAPVLDFVITVCDNAAKEVVRFGLDNPLLPIGVYLIQQQRKKKKSVLLSPKRLPFWNAVSLYSPACQ